MATVTRLSRSETAKELARELRKKVQEAYERGATSEATKLLIEEFEHLRKAYDGQLRILRKYAGL